MLNYYFLVRQIFCLLLFCSFQTYSQVKIYEKVEVIPTYKTGTNEISPMFYTGRSVQGAQGHIYPYPAQTRLKDSLVDVSYTMAVLENEYLIVKVLPAFGGRLFSAIDKTNGHELFHTNSVIKPDLIGTLGAWVSGGIEWCFPHHHRTTTMLPSDYRLIKNEDGSATIWIGETEKTMGMRGIVGMTLRPGKSYIETDYKINNTSKLTKTFLFWANVAVTANEHFRTFWPPSQEIGVFHNNSSFIKWPISNKTDDYGRTSYAEGVDLTWWKNHPDPVSFFMWDIKEGFIGGYDYNAKAGMVHVGDPHTNNASKLWQFGPGLQGQNARRKLTDDGKAYVELMTGTYSNNQPDYSWIMPHEVREAKNYWYPLRDIEIAKNANINASVTLQMRDNNTVFYGFNTTGIYENAKVTLTYNDVVLQEKIIDIDPSKPFTSTYKSKNYIDEFLLKVVLKDSNGNEIISYNPQPLSNPELPQPQERLKNAQDIESVEDLYLSGRFVEQFNRPGRNPDDYYLAALKKSPDDYRVNLALGMRRINQTRYEEGLSYLQKAADKLKIQYRQPKEGEIYYYLGVAHKALGNNELAYKNFARSTWYYQWASAGNYQLSLLESRNGQFDKALDYIKKAYSTNIHDSRINILYSALLRKNNNNEEASKIIDNFIKFDPLSFATLYEKNILKGEKSLAPFHDNMQDVDNEYIEVAINYMNAGLFDEAINLLSSLENPNNSLINYYLAYLYSNENNSNKAKEELQKANRISLKYTFPYRVETEVVLNHVLNLDKQNARAYYLLGNLLYDNRPEEAIDAWRQASDLNNSIPMVERNLAFGSFYHEKNADKAVAYMQKALEKDNSNDLWYAELSKYYDASSLDYKESLQTLEKNISIAKNDILAPKMYVKLLNLNGDYSKALDFLKNHHFRTWEGGRESYWHYVDSKALRARELMTEDKLEEAISHLNDAFDYPINLEVGKSSSDEKNALIHYYLGEVYNQMGNNKKAKEHYTKSINSDNGYRMYDLVFFQGMSHTKLSNNQDANKIFQGLIDTGKSLLDKGSDNELIAVEEASVNNNQLFAYSYYLQALGYKGLGENEKAKTLYQKSLEYYKNNLWANVIFNKK